MWCSICTTESPRDGNPYSVDPNGIHFTISDTGWGKALWGKLYGQWLCEGAVFTYDFDRFDASKILPMWCSICTTESPRVGERYSVSLFDALLSGGTSAFCSGVLLVGSPVFSSAPFDVSVFCADLWYTGTSSLGLGSGSIGAGLSCTGCSFACLWDIGHAPTRRFAHLLLGAIRSDKRRTSIRSLFLMWKNSVLSQIR